MADDVGLDPTATTGAGVIDRHFKRVADRETWRFWAGSEPLLLSCIDEPNFRRGVLSGG
jgi:hypothetical protein